MMTKTEVTDADQQDASQILTLQKLAYKTEAEHYSDWSIPPMTQTLESLLVEFEGSVILKAAMDKLIVGSVRARMNGGACEIGRLIVHPNWQGHGIGSRLLKAIENRCQPESKYVLCTGSKSEANIKLYQRHGYRISYTRSLTPLVTLTYMEKAVL